MADITYKCSQCGATLTVSEYVDTAALTCRACGGQLEKPDQAANSTGAGATIRLAPTIQPAVPMSASTTADIESHARIGKIRSFFPKRLTRTASGNTRRRTAHRSPLHYVLLFVIVLPIAWGLRHGGILHEAELELLIRGALILFGLLHIVLTAQAFNDDVFRGILCVCMPGYSIYYMLTQTDAVSLRVIGAALLIAFGHDLAGFILDVTSRSYDLISRWIAGGGSF